MKVYDVYHHLIFMMQFSNVLFSRISNLSFANKGSQLKVQLNNEYECVLQNKLSFTRGTLLAPDS